MEKLTNEQMAWALEWSAMHLIEHDTQTKAVEELRHCAKHFRAASEKENSDNPVSRCIEEKPIKVHMLESVDCHDCGGGNIIGAYMNYELALNAATEASRAEGYDIDKYSVETFFNFHELEVVANGST